MKKTWAKFFFLFLSFFIVSCQLPRTSMKDSETSSYSSTSSSISSSTSSLSSSEETKVYEKDEDGFYILEDDYFSNKEVVEDALLKKSKIKIVDAPEGTTLYNQIKMFAAGKQISLYNVKTNMSNQWTPEAASRMNNAAAIFQLEGKVRIQLQTNFLINDTCTIRPLAASITPSIDENRRVITFTITKPGQYTIELRAKRTVHLFVDEIKDYSSMKNDANVIYFGPGRYSKENCSLINNENVLNVSSNKTVVIDYGAVIEGSISAYRQSNIKVIGGGIIDGAMFYRHGSTGERQIPIDFNYCNSISFEGISFLDPAGWCFNLYFCNIIDIDNVKIISSRSNGDGISLQSCQDVHVSNSFVRTWDDSLVVKNYPEWNNMSSYGTTRNIHFNECILWTDLAQSMEIGYETYGVVMDDITFTDIIVLHNYHKASISIHNGNNAQITNVKFKNITIEDGSNSDGNSIIEMTTAFSNTWSNGHGVTSLGSIDGVSIDNLLVISGNKNLEITILGAIDYRSAYYLSEHYISNVTICNMKIQEVEITEEYEYLHINELTRNIVIQSPTKQVTGSTYLLADLSEYGENIILV